MQPSPYAAPETRVRSETPSDGKPVVRRTGSPNPGVAVGGGVLILFGVMLWIAGSRYTLMGWHYSINWFLDWLGLPAQLPPIIGYGVLLAMPVGLIYSMVELCRPWTFRTTAWDMLTLYWIVWVLIVLSDVVSTFIGVTQPGAGASRLAQQVASNNLVSGLWSLILTFTPEWFIIGSIRLLRK